MLGFEEELAGWRLLACDRFIFVLVATLCVALWASSAQVLVASSGYDGGRSVACKYFTGTRVVDRHSSVAAGQGCPIIRVG
jgi:hypothetical protein